MPYNLKAIRELINQALTLEEFKDLVLDDFPKVYEQFTEGQTKSHQIRILVPYADKHREIDKLLESIQSINPRVYGEYKPQLVQDDNQPPQANAETPTTVEPPVQKCDVLVLAANTINTQPLQLKQETQLIREKLQQGEFGKNYIVHAEENAFIEDLSKYLLQYEPKILHFSGHGSSHGEIMLNNRQGEIQVLSLQTLSELLSILKIPIECVVFNACFSLQKADEIADLVGCVIGMEKEISDESALIFAEEFYQGLGYGMSYYDAFELGINGIKRLRLPDSQIPHFILRDTSLLGSASLISRTDDKMQVKGDAYGVTIIGDLIHDFSRGTPLCPLWFGTNRKPVDTQNISKGFSGERDNKLHYGICKVAIPKSHKIGSTGSPWWQRLLTLKDDRLKLQSESLQILEEALFWANINQELKEHEINERSALVFIHGYNVSFKDAAIRAAQIGFDLQVPGITAFYSWPSKGKLTGYTADEATIQVSEKYIAEFLLNLAKKSEIEKIHIIAHSMGNRGLLRAMQQIVAQVKTATNTTFGQIFLAAPDVDIDLFQNLASAYHQLAERTTLYVSSKDKALATSGLIHQYPRVGFFPPVTIVEGIDTVQVSKIDLTLLGHGYFADARVLLEDIRDLLVNNTSPDRRQGRLQASEEGGYWIMRE